MASTANPILSLSAKIENLAVDGEPLYDLFNPDLTEFFDNLTPVRTRTWSAASSAMKGAYAEYGSISADWIPLMFTGYAHPDDIPPGATLKIPTKVGVDRINNYRRSRRGETVKI